MLRTIALTVIFGLSAGAQPAVAANASDSQLRALVRMELHNYTLDTDPDELTESQLGVIYTIMHSGRPHGSKSALIRSYIGGRNTLRGLLSGQR